MSERGLSLDHTTIYRWVQRYAPELDKRSRPYLKQNDSWRVDETYVKVRGNWMFLYRAVDSTGQTLDFLLNQTRRLNYPTLNNIQVLEQPNGFSEKFWVGLTSPLHGLSMSTRTPPTLAPSVT